MPCWSCLMLRTSVVAVGTGETNQTRNNGNARADSPLPGSASLCPCPHLRGLVGRGAGRLYPGNLGDRRHRAAEAAGTERITFDPEGTFQAVRGLSPPQSVSGIWSKTYLDLHMVSSPAFFDDPASKSDDALSEPASMSISTPKGCYSTSRRTIFAWSLPWATSCAAPITAAAHRARRTSLAEVMGGLTAGTAGPRCGSRLEAVVTPAAWAVVRGGFVALRFDGRTGRCVIRKSTWSSSG